MENYVGKRLDGRYEVQEIIGVGGMAVVYKAYDSIDDRVVAVKILKDEFLANEEFRRRFKNESKAIAVLSHPNIVKVYDVSYGDRLQYIVMEYIEGITLKEYIEQVKTVSWKEAIHFITQILRALQHAHDKGIVHRDIKPQNIMLVQNGNIKVTDFGIARFSRSETRTMSNNAIGSVHYISPEQARGDITDDKADIYSVGVVLYEMLTGQVPFQSDTSVSVAIMQLQAEPKRPRDINDSIPVGLEQITMKAMQKKIEDRYQSAAEMLLDIEEFKRNPGVKFAYTYFVDKEPTKYVGEMPVKSKASKNETPVITGDGKLKNRTASVIIGVAIGLAILLAVVIGSFAIFTDWFKDDKLTVPHFVGMDYETEIKNNPKYKDFLIATEFEQNTRYNAGEVFQQNPSRGAKIRKTETIQLKIAVGTKMITIPNIYAMQFAQVKSALTNLGFVVSEVAEPNTTVPFGTVLRTVPEQGKQAVQGSTIIVYYASDENLVEVPNLIGFTVEESRRLLESLGLALDENVLKENSMTEKDKVIIQNPEEKLKATKGSKVTITVSTGIPPESTVKISFKLPSKSPAVKGNLMITLNSDIKDEKPVLLDGGNYSYDIVGTGADDSLRVFIDAQLIYSCKINFTVIPGTISDEKTYATPSFAIIPKVTGMDENDAIDALNKAGFDNITVIKKVVSNKNQEGKVISQNPDYSIFISRSIDTQIKLEVGIPD